MKLDAVITRHNSHAVDAAYRKQSEQHSKLGMKDESDFYKDPCLLFR